MSFLANYALHRERSRISASGRFGLTSYVDVAGRRLCLPPNLNHGEEGLHVSRITSSIAEDHVSLSSSTGATGYIGGSALNKVIELYSDLEITALLRSPTEAFTKRYPQVKIVKGTFHELELIEKASEEADIIIRTSNRFMPIVQILTVMF